MSAVTYTFRILSYLKWSTIVVLLFVTAVFGMAYFVNVVYDACRIAIQTQQQENEHHEQYDFSKGGS